MTQYEMVVNHFKQKRKEADIAINEAHKAQIEICRQSDDIGYTKRYNKRYREQANIMSKACSDSEFYQRAVEELYTITINNI